MAYSDDLISARRIVQSKKDALEEKRDELVKIKISKKNAATVNSASMKGKKYTELRKEEKNSIKSCVSSVKGDIAIAVADINTKLSEYQGEINSLTLQITTALQEEAAEDERKRREALESD